MSITVKLTSDGEGDFCTIFVYHLPSCLWIAGMFIDISFVEKPPIREVFYTLCVFDVESFHCS